MPTVWRRYSTSWWPLSAVTSMSPKRMLPCVGVSNFASIESNVVLPQPLAPSSSTSSPVRDVEIERVDRPHLVAAARVLHREVAHDEARHHAPPNASAGSTPTARRSPARLASVPTTMAITARRR